MPVTKSLTKVIILKGHCREGMPECPKGSEQKSLSGIRTYEEAIQWGLRNGHTTVYYAQLRGRVYAFKKKSTAERCDNKASGSTITEEAT